MIPFPCSGNFYFILFNFFVGDQSRRDETARKEWDGIGLRRSVGVVPGRGGELWVVFTRRGGGASEAIKLFGRGCWGGWSATG